MYGEGMRAGLSTAAAFAGILLLAGCQQAERGETAVWELADPALVSAESTDLDVLVTRVACASGVTGAVRAPQVSYERDHVVVTIDVEPLPGDAYDCQGNDAVPVVVRLSEPLGARLLVDGACADPEAADTSFCRDEGIRWG